ncbi:hypothetical protein TSUD_94740 [Trifolium subterraneum]|uniref:Uncharacterized protein n=1 Tax=Trifolium subterraneum TaxID=3900 RepID=A0A2Z6PDI7_TRISU|nr:hypothetical protein TSUD_94740 [Trifolium subterraneum]
MNEQSCEEIKVFLVAAKKRKETEPEVVVVSGGLEVLEVQSPNKMCRVSKKDFAGILVEVEPQQLDAKNVEVSIENQPNIHRRKKLRKIKVTVKGDIGVSVEKTENNLKSRLKKSKDDLKREKLDRTAAEKNKDVEMSQMKTTFKKEI